jgi:hypothetical protein
MIGQLMKRAAHNVKLHRVANLHHASLRFVLKQV